MKNGFIVCLLLSGLYLCSCRNKERNHPGRTINDMPAASDISVGIPDSDLIRFRTKMFKNVETAKLVTDLDLGAAQGVDLPLKADVIRLLGYAGIQENDSSYDMTMLVKMTGEALDYEYREKNSNGISGKHYTAAKFSVEVTFELPSGYRITGKSEFRSIPPEKIYEKHLSPGTAPFAQVYSIPLARAFYQCTYSSFGILPVIEVAEANTWDHYGEQADSFLLSLKDDQVVTPMILALQRQAAVESKVNRSLLKALGRHRDTSAIKPLFLILKSHIEENRLAAEKALDNIDPNWTSSSQVLGLLPSLFSTLSDQDRFLRLSTVHIISRIKDRQSLWYLILLSTDEYLNVRTAAREIMNVNFPHWASSEEARRSIPYLVHFCCSKDAGVRQNVEETLNKIDPDWNRSPEALSVVPELIKLLENPDREIKGNAAEILGRIKDPGAIKPLIALLADDSRYSKERAIRALGELGDKSAIEPLIKLTKSDSEAYVVEAVRDALIMITGKDPGGDYKTWHK